MYFSYFFEILKTEDLKNEQYLELIWLAKDNKEDKPQKKVRGHKNLDLMYELLKWIDKESHLVSIPLEFNFKSSSTLIPFSLK